MKYLLLFLLACAAVNCEKSTGNATVMATETWHMIADGNPADSMNLVFSLLEDSSIIAGGGWVYDYFGEVRSSASSGAAVKEGAALSVKLSGTASYPPDDQGVIQSSPYSLNLEGTFSNGTGSGTWIIAFSNPDWEDSLSGSYTGGLTGGSGVTD